MAVQLVLFSGDVQRYGLAKALSAKNHQLPIDNPAE
jgi:ABC-type taurine transport system ATPase subunit